MKAFALLFILPICVHSLLAEEKPEGSPPSESRTEASSGALEIRKGLSLKETIQTLGEPAGLIELRDKTLLLYPRGEVTLRDDIVVEFDLMTEEAFAADQARLKREREEWLMQQEKLAEARKEEGKAIKAAKLSSSAFAALPAKDRVDYWRSFQIRYPDIDVSEQIASALEGYESELTELRSQQRIAELEARVAAAEREAAAARLEAEKLREETKTVSDRRYGLRYYTDPVIRRNYYYKPPTITIHSNGTVTKTKNLEDRKNYYRFDDNRRPTPQESTAERVSRILNEVRGDN